MSVNLRAMAFFWRRAYSIASSLISYSAGVIELNSALFKAFYAKQTRPAQVKTAYCRIITGKALAIGRRRALSAPPGCEAVHNSRQPPRQNRHSSPKARRLSVYAPQILNLCYKWLSKCLQPEIWRRRPGKKDSRILEQANPWQR